MKVQGAGQIVLRLGSNYANSSAYVSAYSPNAYARVDNIDTGDTVFLSIESTNTATAVKFTGSTADGLVIQSWSNGDDIQVRVYNEGEDSASSEGS